MSEGDYHADPSLYGKLRRRLSRLVIRRPARSGPARPMISFAFDDAPVSASTTAAAILEAHGARGSYFTCAGLAGEVSPSEFRRYGSARRLYHFNVDNAGAY